MFLLKSLIRLEVIANSKSTDIKENFCFSSLFYVKGLTNGHKNLRIFINLQNLYGIPRMLIFISRSLIFNFNNNRLFRCTVSKGAPRFGLLLLKANAACVSPAVR